MRSYFALAMFGLAVTAGPAGAEVLDLGVHNANLFSLGNFSTRGSDVEGAVVVKGNLTASSYSINRKNQDAFGSYSLVVGGNLDYSSASLNNGSYYVGGKAFLNSVGTDRDTKSVSASPADLAAMAAHAKTVSSTLSKLARTGSTSIAYGGMTLTGTRRAVEVFDITGAAFSSVNYFNLNNLQSGATLIFNISGKDAIGFHQNGVGLSAFANYNVLYNFHEATNLNIQNVGVQGSILAPLATVTGGGAQINGNVIVGNWLAGVQVNADHYFKPVNVPGYAALAPVSELSIWPMLAVGLGLILLINVRRRDQLTHPEPLAA
ncbi:choice-of-anchor A family protein [Massilia endophytica]|uniref:choice-of-anchor A family protein n=1 Tax=Massilia endophytica TaxID=2899220 RepID=UPI001E414D60|nr:choice-of-anchor A family protein [Massilia endophytica]UGQ49092.1 choice-of-anchor A family protein [Massilia endophytica]